MAEKHVHAHSGKIQIGGLTERDIDLFFLEEFYASTELQHWFLKNIGVSRARSCRLTQVGCSIHQVTGESDLEMTFQQPGNRALKVLIENKIRANFQRNQADRYKQRGKSYVRNRICSAYRTVLIAPSDYLKAFKPRDSFHSQVSYESIHQWLLDHAARNARMEYKLQILSSAISKGKIGYQMVEDSKVTAFWHDYWRAFSGLSTDVEMNKPSGKPASSSFVYFFSESFPGGICLCHKFAKGFVDLQFKGYGKKLGILTRQLDRLLAPDMFIAKASGSAAVRIKVPILDSNLPFLNQKNDAIKGMRAVQKLHLWFEIHRNRIRIHGA